LPFTNRDFPGRTFYSVEEYEQAVDERRWEKQDVRDKVLKIKVDSINFEKTKQESE
jgi:hypothetical protein